MTRTPAPALSATEAAVVARFDAAEVPTEILAIHLGIPLPPAERVETVARALTEPMPDWRGGPDADYWRTRAAAAIAALLPSPAEEAVEPGLSAESNGRRLAWFTDDELSVELTRRAALASPAPGTPADTARRMVTQGRIASHSALDPK